MRNANAEMKNLREVKELPQPQATWGFEPGESRVYSPHSLLDGF